MKESLDAIAICVPVPNRAITDIAAHIREDKSAERINVVLKAAPETSLRGILGAFRTGKSSFLTNLIRRKIDKVLFAATKADHVHHTEHDKLAEILSVLVEDARSRAQFAGVDVQSVAVSAVRATKEANVKQGTDTLPVLTGTPAKGETIGTETFDGDTQGAVFPGDLPVSARDVLRAGGSDSDWQANSLNFIRFRPPEQQFSMEGNPLPLPHIRMDETLEFLLGDRLA